MSVYSQGVVPVRHELPGGEAQRPGGLGDQAGNGTRKQFAGGDVPEERLLHSDTVGNKLRFFVFFTFLGQKCPVGLQVC